MNKKILAAVAALGLLASYAVPLSVVPAIVSAASSDYYLKIDGVDGEAAVKGHEKEIDIMSWSWGVSQTSTMSSGGGMGAGKVNFQDLHITKMVDKATPVLFKMAATGQHIKKAELKVLRPSPDGKEMQYMIYTFEDVMVTSWQNSADPLVEEISLNFAKVSMEYTPQKPDGKLDTAVKAGYDLKMNKAV